MDPAVLELDGVVKRFGRARAVGPLDLAVGRGQSVALIGPSGAGKSTVLRLMLGLVAPDAGQVRRSGVPLSPSDDAARRACGYVVQGGGLFPHLTAAGNAALVARYLGWDRGRVEERLRALAELARLPVEALERFPGELSGGQAQRVSLMRALFLDPPLLLLDEPLGALDPITRADLQQDLAQAFRTLGKTVVLVTHDLAEAAYLASRLVLLRDGLPEQDGPLEALVRAPASTFVSRFVRAQRGLSLPEGPA